MGGTHCVPGSHVRHAPLPSHLPSLPQVDAAVTPHLPLVSALPAATGEHVPSVALSVHDTHGPSQVALQQTPCAEQTRPDAHCVLAEQGPPFGSRPHEPLMHVAFAAQSALALHVALHAAAPHSYGKHEVDVGVVHFPAPSHVDWPVNVVVVAGHVGSLHFTPAAYFWHAPAVQRPFVPQLAAPWSRHIAFGSSAFVGTFVHTPSVPGRPHDLHAALQVVPQQKPCMQKVDAHSAPPEQGAPGSFLPHELPLQTFGVTQFRFVVQASKHFEPLHAKGRQARDVGAAHWPVALHVGAPV
jgi:hypothetical protein